MLDNKNQLEQKFPRLRFKINQYWPLIIIGVMMLGIALVVVASGAGHVEINDYHDKTIRIECEPGEVVEVNGTYVDC